MDREKKAVLFMVNTSGSYPHKIIKGLEMQKEIKGLFIFSCK